MEHWVEKCYEISTDPSPRPWKIIHDIENDEMCIVDAYTNDVVPDYQFNNVSDYDAEHIVRCVNEYDKMVERLEISPYGDDRIDQLEQCIEFLRHEIKQLKEVWTLKKCEILRCYEQMLDGMHEEHIKEATVNMDDVQKEIYEIGFKNATSITKKYLLTLTEAGE